jgi:hypothetical protein
VRRAQGVFNTVQPFWELIEFLYAHAHELATSGRVRLCLFKHGLSPDVSNPLVARDSRLHIALSEACAAKGMPVTDGATSLLMHIACATSDHEEHIHGVELTFCADDIAACCIWFAEDLAQDADALKDLSEDVSEVLALNVAEARAYVRDEPTSPAAASSRGAPAPDTRVVSPHPNALLNQLQAAIARSSVSPDASQSTTPPVHQRGMLSPPRRRHTAIVLHGLKVRPRRALAAPSPRPRRARRARSPHPLPPVGC